MSNKKRRPKSLKKKTVPAKPAAAPKLPLSPTGDPALDTLNWIIADCKGETQ